uniref:Coiled-coil-helix-coiled-coil-helix domain containing 6 n=1 Tax=Jaculus jaculus TaxID=51337 RepID=A0A8C5K3H3_JACJA
MGSAESAESRRVSFEMDEEERVRVLQGIRLSENVVNRMKDSSQPSAAQQPIPPPTTPPLPPPPPPPPASGPPEATSKAPQTDSKVPRVESSGSQQPSKVKKDLMRFQEEQAAVQDELIQAAKWEREMAAKHLKASRPQERGSAGREQPSERLNAEMYKLSSHQFHEAASKAESTIKPRRVEPVCSDLQAQILRCYRDHVREVLLCSDLVKAYQHCVSAARKG